MIFCWSWAQSSTVDVDRFGPGVYHHVRRVRVEAGGVVWYKPFGWDVDAPLKEGSGVAQGFQAVGPIGGRGVLHPSAGFSLAPAIGQIGCQSCSSPVPVSKMVENHNRVSPTRRRASATSRGGGRDRSVGRGRSLHYCAEVRLSMWSSSWVLFAINAGRTSCAQGLIVVL